MSTVIAKNAQIGTSGTATDNFTIFQPATPDGTLRIGNGNTGITTSLLTLNSSGNLGIGTSSPNAKLNIATGNTGTTIRSTPGIIIQSNGTNTDTNLRFSDSVSFASEVGQQNGGLYFTTSGLERMRLTSAGNFGVGTSSPTDFGSSYRVIEVSGSLGGYSLQSSGSVVTQMAADSGAAVGYTGTRTNHPHVFVTNNTERARIDTSGRFFIGTTSLSTRFAVVGVDTSFYNTATFSDGTTAQYLDIMCNRAMTNGTPQGVSANTVMTFRSSGSSAGVIAFATGNAEAARIDSSGNLLVGTTTAIEKFTVNGWVSVNGQAGISGNASTIVTNCNGGSWYGLLIKNLSTSTSQALTFANSSNGVVGSVIVTSTATSYNTSSDYRLKEDIQPMTGALAKVTALKPVTYKWKADGSDGEGFIAHELQEVVPQCVTGEKDAVDAEGNPKYQGIDTSFLVATLTAAIKELKAEFDAYKATHP